VPELPEVQALAERLTGMIGGATFVRADALHFSSLKTVTPRASELEGRTLERAGRRGKYLVLGVASTSRTRRRRRSLGARSCA